MSRLLVLRGVKRMNVTKLQFMLHFQNYMQMRFYANSVMKFFTALNFVILAIYTMI
jgi:hypothetical protein